MIEREEHPSPSSWFSQLTLAGSVFLLACAIDFLAQGGTTGLIISGLAAFVAFRHGDELIERLHALSFPSLPQRIPLVSHSLSEEDVQESEPIDNEEEEEDMFLFSAVLRDWHPSLDRIYLATLEDGSCVSSDARGLCHVAIAGSTGGGKSSLIRLLLCQLCKAGASVLVLNPHYTRYDLDADEDWTPFEPYLVYDPLACRSYPVIEHYLQQVATVLLPKRLEKYAHSQPVGKPYFLVIDELPAIVDNIPDAPKYLAKILREGRKVGILLVTAAQDFLVKTIAPQGGGAIRDCYRTAFYVGGDPTTARILLDIPASQIEEERLGKGTVMLRSKTVKQARLAAVPYVDNQALYDLLGPSTYAALEADEEDDLFLEQLPLSNWNVPQLQPEEWPITKDIPEHLQRVRDAYSPGITYRELADKLGIGKDTAGKWLSEAKRQGVIALDRQTDRQADDQNERE